MKKRILVYDTWLNGLRFVDFLPLNYPEQEWLFLHTSSLFGEGHSSSAWSEPKYDLCEWAYDIKQCLDSLKPTRVLVISIHNYEQRLLINICNQLDIPVDFYPHGIRVFERVVRLRNKSIAQYALRFLSHLNKLSILLMANKTFFSWALRYRIYFNVLARYNKFKNGQLSELPITVRRVALNSREQGNYFRDNWLLSDSSFFVTSNVKNLFDAKRIEESFMKRDVVLFIGQPLLGKGLAYISLFNELASCLAKTNAYQLLLRPHPTQTALDFKDLNSSITITEEDLSTLMQRVKFVVGVNSALLYLPELLGIPRIIFNGVDSIDFPDISQQDLLLSSLSFREELDVWLKSTVDSCSYSRISLEEYWSNWQEFIEC